jgi:hypothetical protein
MGSELKTLRTNPKSNKKAILGSTIKIWEQIRTGEEVKLETELGNGSTPTARPQDGKKSWPVGGIGRYKI